MVRLRGNLDGGLSWFIALSAFMTHFVAIGIHNVFGLLYIDLLEEFRESKATTAGVASISYGLTFFCAPLSCLLIKKFDCRVVAITGGVLCGLGLLLSSFVDSIHRMYVTYSFLFGVGCSMCYCSSILVLNNYFSKYLVVANGISLSGAGVGTITLAPALSLLLDSYYWRDALRLLSMTCIVLVISGIIYFLVPVPMERVDAEEYKEDKTLFDFSVLKNKAFLAWICAASLVLFGYYIPYVHLLHHGQELGISKQDGAALVGYMAMSQTFGKIVFGRIADHPRVNRLYLYQMCLLVCSVLTTLLPVLTTYDSLLAYCLLFGFHDGCSSVLLAVLTVDIAGRKTMASALGIMYSSSSISMMLGPLVAGWMYPASQSYVPAFYMAGAFTTLGVCLLFLVPWLLSPVIANEWHMRSKNFRERILSSTSSDATKSWTLDSGSWCLEPEKVSGVSRNTNKELNVLFDKDVIESNIEKREDIDFNFENQFFMPKLTGRQDYIHGRFHDYSKDIWIHISDPSRETWV